MQLKMNTRRGKFSRTNLILTILRVISPRKNPKKLYQAENLDFVDVEAKIFTDVCNIIETRGACVFLCPFLF